MTNIFNSNWDDLTKPSGLNLPRHHDGPALNANDIQDLKTCLPTQGITLSKVIEKIEATLDKADDPGKKAANQLARLIVANIIESNADDDATSDDQQSYARLIAVIKATEPYSPLANIQGFGLAVTDTIKAASSMMIHPIDTTQALANALLHPLDSWRAMQAIDRGRLVEILRAQNAEARQAAFAEMNTAGLLNTYFMMTGGLSLANIGRTGFNTLIRHFDDLPPPGPNAVVTPENIVFKAPSLARADVIAHQPWSLGNVFMAAPENNHSQSNKTDHRPSQVDTVSQALSPEERRTLIQRFVTELTVNIKTPTAGDMQASLDSTLQQITSQSLTRIQPDVIHRLWNQVQYLAPHDSDATAWIFYGTRARHIGKLLEDELNVNNLSARIKLPGLEEGTQNSRAYIPSLSRYPSSHALADAAFSELAINNYEHLNRADKVLARMPISKTLPLDPDAQAVLIIEKNSSNFEFVTGGDSSLNYRYEFGQNQYVFVLVKNELSKSPKYHSLTPEQAKELVVEARNLNHLNPNRDVADLAIDRLASWEAAFEKAQEAAPGGPDMY